MDIDKFTSEAIRRIPKDPETGLLLYEVSIIISADQYVMVDIVGDNHTFYTKQTDTWGEKLDEISKCFENG